MYCIILILLGLSINSWILGYIVGIIANIGEQEHAREKCVSYGIQPWDSAAESNRGIQLQSPTVGRSCGIQPWDSAAESNRGIQLWVVQLWNPTGGLWMNAPLPPNRPHPLVSLRRSRLLNYRGQLSWPPLSCSMAESSHCRRTVNNIRAHLAAYDVPLSLRARVDEYLFASFGNDLVPVEKEVLKLLPPALRLDASKQLRLDLLGHTKLAGLLPPKLLAKLCTMTEEIYISPGEILMLQGDTGSDMYIVHSGELEVISHPPLTVDTLFDAVDSVRKPNGQQQLHAPVVLATLGRGSVLGELTFFLGTKRSASVRAVRRAGAEPAHHRP